MHDERRPALRPRSSQPEAYVFAKRLGLIVLAFLLLVPVAKRLGRDVGDQVVAAKAAVATTTPALADAPVASTAPAAPTTVFVAATVPPTVAPPAAVQAAPKVTSAPKATSASKPKQSVSNNTTAPKKATAPTKPKPVVTAAPKPKPKVTAAPKPKPRPAPTPAPPPARTYSAAEVEAIIRQVWPDALEDHALAIAKRESKLVPSSRNWCCYGLFAIYYEAGKRLLNSIGVINANQLFDPWVNSRAAVAIYQSAGWDPWKL
jgi:hypothetical protein